MIYPHLFWNKTTGKFYVKIALSDYSVHDTAWMDESSLPGIHEVLVPTVDLTSEVHEFDTETQAIQFIKDWWTKREDVTSLAPFSTDDDAAGQEPKTQSRYFLIASTGCTCCSSDNRVFGPFLEEKDVIERATSLRDQKYVASQYSPNGRYTPLKAEVEILTDGRLIWGDKILSADEGQELGHPDDFPAFYGVEYLTSIT